VSELKSELIPKPVSITAKWKTAAESRAMEKSCW
jgi:hypothetical protein